MYTLYKLLLQLPDEGKKSKRAFALFCVERVAPLSDDPRVAAWVETLRRRVARATSVTEEELASVSNAAMASSVLQSGSCNCAARHVARAVSYATNTPAIYTAEITRRVEEWKRAQRMQIPVDAPEPTYDASSYVAAYVNAAEATANAAIDAVVAAHAVDKSSAVAVAAAESDAQVEALVRLLPSQRRKRR